MYISIHNTCISIHNTCIAIHNTCIAIHNTCIAIHNTCISIHNTCIAIHNTCISIHNTCIAIHNTCIAIHNTCIAIHNTCTCIAIQVCYSPLSGALQDTAGDSMTINNFFQEAVASISSHFSNIWLQHHLTLVGHPPSMAFSSPLGRPSSVPITFQSAAYCGVMCR